MNGLAAGLGIPPLAVGGPSHQLTEDEPAADEAHERQAPPEALSQTQDQSVVIYSYFSFSSASQLPQIAVA